MHYLIDGYNLLFRLLNKTKQLEQQRQMMIEELNDAVVELNLSVTLVFDGDKGALPPTLKRHFKALTLVYTTEGQSADEYILEEVEHARHPRQLSVVTNDRELKTRCHRLGTESLTIDAFLALLVKKRRKNVTRAAPSEHVFADSQRELARLLAIFEKKLREED